MRWLAITLLCLLWLGFVLDRLQKSDSSVRPSPYERGRTGYSEFADLLKKEGYTLVYQPKSTVKPAPDDVLLLPVVRPGELPSFATEFVKTGGHAVVFNVPDILTRPKRTVKIYGPRDAEKTVDEVSLEDEVTIGSIFEDEEEELGVEKNRSLQKPDSETSAWYTGADGYVKYGKLGKGRVVNMRAGDLLTNRLIGRNDNAAVGLVSVRLVAPKGARLLFLPHGYGESASISPLQAIGPGAIGALWQALACLAVFGLAKGVRFGLSRPERVSIRGSRELVDALATFYRRGRRTDVVMRVVEKETGVPASAPQAKSKYSEVEALAAIREMDLNPRKRR